MIACYDKLSAYVLKLKTWKTISNVSRSLREF